MTSVKSNRGGRSARSLETRLRSTLHAARGNPQIRERLVEVVLDPARFDPIVREFGASHSLVRALLVIARHGAKQLDPAAWSRFSAEPT